MDRHYLHPGPFNPDKPRLNAALAVLLLRLKPASQSELRNRCSGMFDDKENGDTWISCNEHAAWRNNAMEAYRWLRDRLPASAARKEREPLRRPLV